MKDDDFCPVTGGRGLSPEQRYEDPRSIYIPLEPGLDREIALLLSLHSHLPAEDTDDMCDVTKRAYLERLRKLLGIKL